MLRRLLTFFIVALVIASAPLALPVQRILMTGSFYDGIDVDFVTGANWVKRPGEPARLARFDQIFAFTRGSTASFLGSDGLIQYANENRQRNSNDMSAAGYFANGSPTITPAAAAGPDGTLTATQIEATGAGGTGIYAYDGATIPGVAYTFSVYFKYVSGVALIKYGSDNAPTTGWFNVNPQTCAVSNVQAAVVSYGSQGYGNGWCRVWGVAIATSTTMNIISYSTSSSAHVWLEWGAQFQTGTRVGAILTTTSAARYDAPRVEYDASGSLLGLKMEGPRLNLALRSQQYNVSPWVPARATISADAAVAPDGTLTADKLVEDATASDTHFVNQSNLPVTGGLTYAHATFAKAAERTWLYVNAYDGVLSRGAYFNLSTCAVGTLKGGASAYAVQLPNGWCRLVTIITVDATSTVTSVAPHLATADNTITYSGDGSSGAYVWGETFDNSPFATSYTPTGATAVLRFADAAVLNAGREFSVAAGTQAYDFSFPYLLSSVTGAKLLFGNDSNGYTYVNGANDAMQFWDGSTTTYSPAFSPSTLSGSVNVVHKSAVSYSSVTGRIWNASDGSMNATPGAFDGTQGAASTVYLGAYNTNQCNCHIKRWQYYLEAKSPGWIKLRTQPGKMVTQ